MTRLLSAAAALALMAGSASAEIALDRLVAQLNAQGYDRIEIEVGPTTTEVEAVNTATRAKIEYALDNATGSIIGEVEQETADDDDLSPGVEIEYEDDSDDDDDDDDNNDDDGSDDEDDDDDDDDDDEEEKENEGDGEDDSDDDESDDD